MLKPTLQDACAFLGERFLRTTYGFWEDVIDGRANIDRKTTLGKAMAGYTGTEAAIWEQDGFRNAPARFKGLYRWWNDLMEICVPTLAWKANVRISILRPILMGRSNASAEQAAKLAAVLPGGAEVWRSGRWTDRMGIVNKYREEIREWRQK